MRTNPARRRGKTKPPPNPPSEAQRIPRYAMVAALLVIAALLGTSPMLPMAWDEGNAVLRAHSISRWFARWTIPAADGLGPFDRQAIDQDWPYTTKVEGHPALYGAVIALGEPLASSWWAPLEAARFGPICLFGVAAGALFYRLARDYSLTAGAGGVAALLLLPRLFAHAHFASFDGPLTSCWVLTWAAFAPALERRRNAVLWGVLLGMTLSTKFTGWIAPLPFVLWALIVRERRAVRTLLIGIPTALLVFVLLNPPLWYAPLQGFLEFLRLNLHRRFNIPTQFLGRRYDLDHNLPWYNTALWTTITVPVGLLVLSVMGAVTAARRPGPGRGGWLLIANCLALLAVRALPIAPPHDGERLLLPSFAFLAALVGVGTNELQRWLPRQWPRSEQLRRVAAPVVLAVIYAGSAFSLVWYAPQWLSYYSLAIGGLRGATHAGMEPTYYWDSFDAEVRRWLAEHTAEDEKVCLANYPDENAALLRHWGLLEVRVFGDAPGRYRWYVLQLRPSVWTNEDRWLVANATPAFSKVIRPAGWGPWRLDVPLLNVYAYQDYLQARERVQKP